MWLATDLRAIGHERFIAHYVVRAAVLFVAYFLVLVWLTWPLARHLGTHFPNTWLASYFDPPTLAWALAHQSRALIEQPFALPHGRIYHPAPYALFYGEAGFGALPYFMPVFLLTGNPALALNLTFLGCLALTALSLHLVVYRWTGSHAGGAVAAGTFLLTRWVLWPGIACLPTYAVLQYFPVIVYLAASPTWSPRRTLALTFLVTLQGLTSIYVAAAVVAPLSMLAVGQLFGRTTRESCLPSITVASVSSACLLLCYSGSLQVRLANPNLLTQAHWRIPTEIEVPLGPLSYWAPAGIPFTALLLILARGVELLRPANRRRRSRTRRVYVHATVWVLIGLCLSLSPTVRWNGEPMIAPQGLLLSWFPLYGVLRISSRLAIAALIGGALLTGLSFSALDRWVARNRKDATASWLWLLPNRAALIATVVVAMYIEYVGGTDTPLIGAFRSQTYFLRIESRAIRMPERFLAMGMLPTAYPLAELPSPSPALLPHLRASNGPLLELPVDGTILEQYLPVLHGSPEYHAAAMYRSIFHRRPLVNGYNSYWPQGFPERMELARRLPDRDALATLHRQTGLEMILVHTDALAVEERRKWVTLLTRSDEPNLHLVARDGGDLLFAVQIAE